MKGYKHKVKRFYWSKELLEKLIKKYPIFCADGFKKKNNLQIDEERIRQVASKHGININQEN